MIVKWKINDRINNILSERIKIKVKNHIFFAFHFHRLLNMTKYGHLFIANLGCGGRSNKELNLQLLATLYV